MRNHGTALLWILFCLFALTHCVHTRTRTDYAVPQGFAVYDQTGIFKAVSPDGVVYRIRTEKNKPFAKLPFWKEALKKHMIDAGYIFSQESQITAGTKQGYLLELTTSLGQQDYAYLIAIFMRPNKEILIVETAGEILRLSSHRQAILAAIQDIIP